MSLINLPHLAQNSVKSQNVADDGSSPTPILYYCEDLPQRVFEAGEIILKEGSKSNRLYILVEGGVEVRKDGVLLKVTAETGAVFGEISVLLDIPHMASVIAKVSSRFYEVANAAGFIDLHPELGIALAKVLAQRLTGLSQHFSGAKLLLDRLMEASPESSQEETTRDVFSSALALPLQRILSSPITEAAGLAAVASAKAEGRWAETRHQRHGVLEKRLEERTRDLELQVLERTRAEKNLQQQFSRISLLNQITRAISERQDFNSILQVVLRQLECNLPIDFGAVLLTNESADSVTVATTQLKRHASDGPLQLREGDVLSVARTGLAGCLQGRTFYAKDTARVPEHLFQVLAAEGLNCAVAVPLMAAEKPFGVLLGARRTVDAFSSGECEFFRMLCDHVALAAHQARLYEQLQTAYEELKATQQAVMQQERLRALGEMASGIAHDINNALSPIVVYSDLIARNEKNLSEATRRQLKSIMTAGEDIAHFVSRMRDFYRKRDGSDEFAFIDCNGLVEQVIDLTRPRWHDIPLEKGIVIEMCPELRGAPDMDGNPSELREALTNLILNAVDAMPSGGKLLVRTRVENRPTPDDSIVTFEVIDSGTGMDEETRRRCLEPFYSTKGQRGTGLGLAMVYGIVERHDGKIEIESALGKGTTIRMIFPARRRSKAMAPVVSERAFSVPLRILYIDDEPLLRDLLKEALERDGHSVAVAENGQAGLDAFRTATSARTPFDVVVTDLGMPHMDGRQVAQTIKNESPHIPVVLLTGWGAMMKSEGSETPNIDAVVGKPPRAGELRETLRRLTEK